MGDIFHNLYQGMLPLLGVTPMIFIIVGVISGIMGGAIPGISPSMAVALLLPFTFSMEPTMAIVLLISCYIGANYGGSITAVSINTPGTPSAAVTAFDGYPMAKSGRAGEAMGISLYASVFGGIIGTLILIFFSVPLAKVALKFWPSEYFALCVLGLTTVATLGGTHWQKALVSVLFGLLLNTIGFDPILGVSRFTFKITNMFDGFSLIPVLIGLFALGEVFSNIENYDPKEQKFEKISYQWPPVKYYWKLRGSMLRSSVLGTIVGIFPGAGGTIASFLAYDMEKRMSKHPEQFGKGAPEGVVAAEAANSSSVGGAMVPLLTLGIPGSSTAAVLIGALMIHDLQPGPELFVKAPEVVYGMFVSMFIANAFMLFIGLWGSKLWVRVTDLRKSILYPLIFTFSIVGSYAVNNSLFDVGVCIAFGVVGWLFKRYGYPAAPIVLGLVLGRIAEMNFRQAVMVSGYRVFYTRPLTLILLIISVAAVVLPIVQKRVITKRREQEAQP